MTIKFNYNEMLKALHTVLVTTSDSNLDVTMKNIIFWVQGDKVIIVSNNIYATTFTDMNVSIKYSDNENPELERFLQIQVKPFFETFKAFSNLKRTEVSGVEIEVEDKSLLLKIYETVKGSANEGSEGIVNLAKYRFTQIPIKAMQTNLIKTSLATITNTEKYVIKTADLNYYFNAIVPMITADKRVFGNVTVLKDKIYATPIYCAIVMDNKLADKGFSDFTLRSNVVKFIKQLIDKETEIQFSKTQMSENVYMLVIESEDTKTIIQVGSLEDRFRIELIEGIFTNGIVVNKEYLYDVLRRLPQTSSLINIDITINEGKGSMLIVGETFTQSIPVELAKGSGTYLFSINTQNFKQILMQHWKEGNSIDNLFFYVEQTGNDSVGLVITDKTKEWYVKLPKLFRVAEYSMWK